MNVICPESVESDAVFSKEEALESRPYGTSETSPLMAIRQPAPWLDDALLQICRLSTLSSNWDSYGANAPNLNSLVSAQQFLVTISQIVGVPKPSVTLSPDGNAAMSWEWDDDSQNLDVEIRSDGEIRYAFFNDETDLDGTTRVPGDIATILTSWSSY